MKTIIKAVTLLALVLAILPSCGKSGHKGQTDGVSKITLVADKSTKRMALAINADPSEQANIWIDKNMNGTCDEGEQVTLFTNFQDHYTESKEILSEYNSLDPYSFSDAQKLANSETIDVRLNSDTLVIYGAVSQLSVRGTRLESIDISESSSIQALDCSRSELKSLKVGDNNSLQFLNVSKTDMTQLDLSQCESIETLYASSSSLTDLKLPKANSNLKVLNMYHSLSLKELDLSNQTNLKTVSLYEARELRTLNLSGCTGLEAIICDKTDVAAGLTLNNCGVKYMSITGSFIPQSAGGQGADVLDLTALKSLEWFKLYITADDEGIEPKLDVSGLDQLKELDAGTRLSGLILKGNSSLETLTAYSCNLTELDLSDCRSLKKLEIYDNKLQKINLSNVPELEYLSASDNDLQEINLSKVPKLTYLSVSGNNLSSINISACPNLSDISLSRNPMSLELMVQLIKTLPNRTGKDQGQMSGTESLYNQDIESEARKILEERNWNYNG
ncbi:hypothetical protein [uncultured Porphyromonas sp.]|mgnify:CR=1 FL=1|uniref:hypothetical protein n=1 Tax=uncultured Porphyromonas sp. TaxID=159274 RepID=UPI00280596C3|nr:hypothetical protein [uncultured Porphyromonas sp.]